MAKSKPIWRLKASFAQQKQGVIFDPSEHRANCNPAWSLASGFLR
jgi:hypothetical protein